MKNYRLQIQYDGTNYAGWQIQNNALSIQQLISEKIGVILRSDHIKLTGSGRTDAGVHALGQTANFHYDEILDLRKFTHSLNALLPDDISILQTEETSRDFHSRFSARKRSYLYLLNSLKSPFYHKYTWLDSRFENIDIQRLNQFSKVLTGVNDFTSFCKKSTEVDNKICNIFDIRWYKKGHLIFMFIEADRYLHGMVRTITGTLVKSLNEKNPEMYLQNILSGQNRELAAESAPAKGLFLFKVHY